MKKLIARLRPIILVILCVTVSTLATHFWPAHPPALAPATAPRGMAMATGTVARAQAVVAPSSGDNGTTITTAIASNSGKEPLLVQSGTYSATTPIALASNSAVTFGPGTTYNANVTTGPSPGVGWTDTTMFAPKVVTLLTTLSADVTLGSTTVSVTSTSGFTAGSWIDLYRGAGDMAMSYQVASVGTGTVTLDRPVQLPFKSGDPIYALTPNQAIKLDLGSATFNVTAGSRDFWIPFGVDVEIANATFNSSVSTFGLNFDIGMVRGRMRNLHAVFVANTVAGAAIEDAEDTLVDSCFTDGAFQQGWRVSGYNVIVRDSGARGFVQIGLALQESAPTVGAGTGDLGACTHCKVERGVYWGGQYGVVLRSNSTKNHVVGATTGNASVSGFYLATGTATTVTTGVAANTIADCKDEGSAAGYTVGDGVSGADGNTLVSCVSDKATSYGFLIQGDATNTSVRECAAVGGTSGSGYGFSISGTATLGGCRSEKNQGRGLYVAGTAVVTGYTSSGDGAAGGGRDAVRSDGTGSLTLIGAYLDQTAALSATSWNGFYNNSTGTQVLRDVRINLTGSGGVAVYAVAAGRISLRDVKVTDSGSANYGLYVAAGIVEIGPGCDFSATAAPFTNAGGSVTMDQSGGVLAISSTHTLTFPENYNKAIELSAAATADSTATTLPIKGLRFTGRNLSTHNLIIKTSTSGDSGVTIPTGKTQVVEVNDTATKMVAATAAQ